MGRPESQLEPQGDPLADLARQLRQLRKADGGRGYRQLAKSANFAPSTLARAANGRSLPSWELTAAYVRACSSDPEQVRPWWVRAATKLGRIAGPDDPPANVSAVRQLPADLPDFTGRAGLVRQLRDTLSGVTVIFGLGGVGKTSLAVHIAHRVRAAFPDGQLYGDLRGTDVSPAPPGEILAGFLRALGKTEAAALGSVAEQAAAYRSASFDRKMLVLLDNAYDAAQIRPLLPGSVKCAVLVTSRRRLSGLAGARSVGLDVLTTEESLALLDRIVGGRRLSAEPESAADVVSACGRLPLAVRIAGIRLAERPGWTVASFARRLEDNRRRIAELRVGDLAVEASFQTSYDQLGDVQARAFRLTALPDVVEISAWAASALLGLSVETAEELLESLVDAGLLHSRTAGRYRYHDLLRLHARRLATVAEPGADRAEAMGRLLDFHTATTCNAFRVVSPMDTTADRVGSAGAVGVWFTDLKSVRGWAQEERTNILTLIAQTAQDEAIPIGKVAGLLYCATVFVALGYGHLGFETAARTLADKARSRGDPRAEAIGLSQLGHALLRTGRSDKAVTPLSRAVELFRAAGEEVMLAETLNYLGFIAFQTKNFDLAATHFANACAIQRRHGDQVAEATLLGSIARVNIERGRPEQAVATSDRNLALFRGLCDVTGEIATLYILGLAQHRLGRTAEAAASFEACLDRSRSVGQPYKKGEVLLRLANLKHDAGQSADAVRLAEEALKVFRETDNEYQAAHALTLLGRTLPALGQTRRAHERLVEARKILTSLGLPLRSGVNTLATAYG